ncbi:hypothetical protein DCS_02358 [Drechmeria coniospora]|uniref:Uncharacterized protein n=1 Tax=Drechmeria coniospora TaxID=98403 RepID=A0A151GVS8_DRECN|nr:hypothetical protein DCS_02358 [Drechmeria coniospora]KYK61217.1 hypothetical protein DCS_02358 [Drechmeria coniospora]
MHKLERTTPRAASFLLRMPLTVAGMAIDGYAWWRDGIGPVRQAGAPSGGVRRGNRSLGRLHALPSTDGVVGGVDAVEEVNRSEAHKDVRIAGRWRGEKGWRLSNVK